MADRCGTLGGTLPGVRAALQALARDAPDPAASRVALSEGERAASVARPDADACLKALESVDALLDEAEPVPEVRDVLATQAAIAGGWVGNWLACGNKEPELGACGTPS